MEKEKTLKLILFRDCIKIKTIIELKTEEGLTSIIGKAEKWKSEDIKKNTVRFSIETNV